MSYDIRDMMASLAERRIQDAMDAGEFDGLPGEGEPLPGAGRPDDDLWWFRKWLERQGDEVKIRPAT